MFCLSALYFLDNFVTESSFVSAVNIFAKCEGEQDKGLITVNSFSPLLK